MASPKLLALLLAASVARQVLAAEPTCPWSEDADDVAGDGFAALQLKAGASELAPSARPAARVSRPGRKRRECPGHDNVVHYTLIVDACHIKVGDISTWTRCYNGTIPGPTMRVKPGQTLNVTLINRLSGEHNPPPELLNVTGYGEFEPLEKLQERFEDTYKGAYHGTGSLFGHVNSTNLHTHGLVAAGVQPADDVLITVKPGESFNYSYEVPIWQMSGTHWYHPHRHHATGLQANGGMFGALIVDDLPRSLPPEYAMAEERLLLINTLNATIQGAVARMAQDRLWQSDSKADVTLVNMEIEPTLPMESGKWYRLRMIYAAEFRAIRMKLLGMGVSCQMKLIAKDGIFLNEAPRDVRLIFLASGNRADVMVSCACTVGHSCSATMKSTWGPKNQHQLNEAKTHWGDNVYQRTWVGNILHLAISGRTEPRRLPSFEVHRPCYLADLQKAKILPGNNHTLEFKWLQENATQEYGKAHAEYQEMYSGVIHGVFAIGFDGKVNRMLHDHQSPMATIPLEQVQEWTVHGTEWHPMHMHVQPFQLTALNTLVNVEQDLDDNFAPTEPLPSALNKSIQDIGQMSMNWYREGDWQDTFFGLSDPVVVRFAPRLWGTRTFVVHCHFLNHEDQGMMTFFNVSQGEKPGCKGNQCAKFIDRTCYTEASGVGYKPLRYRTPLRARKGPGVTSLDSGVTLSRNIRIRDAWSGF